MGRRGMRSLFVIVSIDDTCPSPGCLGEGSVFFLLIWVFLGGDYYGFSVDKGVA